MTEKIGVVGGIVAIGVCILLAIGWVMNLIAVIAFAASGAAMAEVTFMIVLRVIAIFVFPLGGVLGWF